MVCSLIVAGLLKGTIGVSMPVVALPLLSLFIDVKSAAMLLSMPLVFSNLPQALEGGKIGQSLMQLMPVFLGMIPGLFLGVRVLLAADANVASYRRPSAYGCRRHHAAPVPPRLVHQVPPQRGEAASERLGGAGLDFTPDEQASQPPDIALA